MPEQKSENGVAVTVEPRYARMMPWVLIVLGVALALYAADLRSTTSTSSKTTERTLPAIGTGQQSPATGEAQPTRLVTSKVTTTESAPSDALLGALFGAAALLALAGAFYSRISKITLPGGSGLEMAAATQDITGIAKAVTELVRKELEKKPPAEREALGADDVAELTLKVASAALLAQQQALQFRVGAFTVRPAAAPLTVEAGELERVRRGMPLSDDLVKRLARNAVSEVFREPDEEAE